MSQMQEEVTFLQYKKDIEVMKKACDNLKEENAKLLKDLELLNSSKKQFPKVFFKQATLGDREDESH